MNRLYFLVFLVSLSPFAHAAETPRAAVLGQLQKVQAAILDHRTNLRTSEKNLETIEAEVETLKRLEAEHVQLRADVQQQIVGASTKEKGKARENFLRKAAKLDAEVQKQLGEIRSRFAPLETERVSWNERKAKYEASLAELTKAEAALNEKLAGAASQTPEASPK